MSGYDSLLTEAEQRYGLPSGLLHGMMRTESGGNPNARSPKGAVGLMQFMPATAKQYGIDPTDPVQSIDGAARLMRDNLKAANGDVGEALRIYQGGTNRAIRGPENAAYAGKVMGSMPSDSGDLAAMGFGKPPTVDTPDLNSAGLSATPDAEIKRARDDLDAMTSVTPAADKVTQDVNGIIANGVKQKLSPDQIKSNVYAYQSTHGIDPTKTKGLDEAIEYHSSGGKGASPVLNTAKIIPMNMLQKVAGGVRQGVEDVDATFDPLAKLIARNAGPLDRFGTKLGLPTVDQAVDVHNQDRSLFGGTLAHDTTANIARVGGNIAASAPLIMGGNALAGRVAGALPESAAPVTNFIAGNGGGNLITRAASLATHGATEGVMGAAATSGASDAPLADQLTTGGIAGSILGPTGALIAKGGSAIIGALSPEINPITAQLAQKASNYGISVSGSQISNSPFIKTVDSVLARVPGSGMAARNETQKQAFTAGVARTFGADSPNLTPEVMDRARDNIGNTMNTIANRTRINIDDRFINDLAGIEDDAHQVVTGQEFQPLYNQLNNIIQKVRGEGDGRIDGDVYQALTRKGAPLDRAMSSSNPNVAHYAGLIRDSLDDALERSASTEDVTALRAARFAYKNMKTVEPLVAKSPDGTISPAALNARVSAKFPNRAYDGGGPLGDLADIGQRFLKDQGSSNTAERSQQYNMLMNAAKVGGGALTALLGIKAGVTPGEIGAIVGSGTAAVAAGRTAAAALNSKWYRNELLNSALNNDRTGGAIAPWLSQNFTPLTVAGGNRLLQSSTPADR